MSYLICQGCGKHYPLPEGETSFNYQNCSCGGKLRYSPKATKQINGKWNPLPYVNEIEDKEESIVKIESDEIKSVNEKESIHPTLKGGIKWKGVFVGLLFLFVSLIASVIVMFGTNLTRDPTNIPFSYLYSFSIITIILTVAAGSISAYLSGSKRYREGAINGSMVGLLLGLILGLAGGFVVFISGTLVFGLLSMAGGIIGIFPRKLFKK